MKRSILVVLLALIALLLYGGSRLFERVNERVYVGLRGEARSNPYLAAQRLFSRLGYRVATRGQPRIEALDRQTAVLLFRRVSKGEAPAWLEWVARGGDLIADVWSANDVLLEELDLHLTHRSSAFDLSELLDLEPGTGKSADASAVSNLRVAGKMLSVDTARMPRFAFGKHQPDRQIADSKGALVVNYVYGQGSVTLVAHSGVYRNAQICLLDHAELLVHLVGETPRRLWIVHEPLVPNLWRWLREQAVWPLSAAALALALALWRYSARFGPMLPEPPRGRLSFRDHLVASGRFHWRQRNASRWLKLLAADRSVQAALGAGAPGVIGEEEGERGAAALVRAVQKLKRSISGAKLFSSGERS